MFDGDKLLIIIFEGYIFLCLPPYSSNCWKFEIKFLVPRTSDVRGSNVVILRISFYLYAFVNILVKKYHVLNCTLKNIKSFGPIKKELHLSRL